MWTMLKVGLAASATVGLVGVPIAVHSAHAQAATAAAKQAAQFAGITNAACAAPVTAPSDGAAKVSGRGSVTTVTSQAAKTTTTSLGSTTVYTGRTHTTASTNSSASSASKVTVKPQPPTVKDAKPIPLRGLVTQGTVKTVSAGKLTLTVGGKDYNFVINGSTHFTWVSWPMKPEVEEVANAWFHVKAGDTVMVIAKGGTALQVIDRGQFKGRYLPNGSGQITVNMSGQASSSAVSGSASGAMTGQFQ